MRRYSGESCKECGKSREEAGGLSWRGLCDSCSTASLTENATAIANHSGDAFLRWRRSIAASVGGILVEDIPPELRSQISNF